MDGSMPILGQVRKPDLPIILHFPTGGISGAVRDMDAREVVAKNLAALMAYKEISVNALAKKAGVGRYTIDGVLAGRNTGIETLQKIAEALGTQAWVLLTPHPKPDDLPVKPVTKTEVQLYKRLGKVAREYDELQREQQREEGSGGASGPNSETPRSIGDGTRDGSIRGDDD